MTDVRRERIPLLWSTVGQTVFAKGFRSDIGKTKYPCVRGRTKLPGKGAASVQLEGQRNRQETSQRKKSCDR